MPIERRITTETEIKEPSLVARALDTQQKWRRKLLNAWEAGISIMAVSFGIAIGGDIADSIAAINVGLVGTAVGALLTTASTYAYTRNVQFQEKK